MKIENPALLRLMRKAGNCQWCGRWCQRREVAHVFAKGMGGGKTLDVRINCLSVCLGKWAGNWRGCDVHGESHVKPADFDLLAVVAAREGELQDDIERAIRVLQNLDKACRPWQLERALEHANEAVKRLVNDALKGRV